MSRPRRTFQETSGASLGEWFMVLLFIAALLLAIYWACSPGSRGTPFHVGDTVVLLAYTRPEVYRVYTVARSVACGFSR